jgi:hypothetical protein
MQTRKDERELVEWFADVLRFRRDDRAVASFDHLKSGVAVVQLFHSIAPQILDLARCDFLASTPFHYGKNWKLAQEAVAVMQLEVKIEIDMLVQGDRNRALYALTQYLKHNYEILKHKFLMQQKGSGHTSSNSLHSSQPQALALVPGGPKSSEAPSSKPPRSIPAPAAAASTAADGSQPPDTPHKTAQKRQQTYDPEGERREAIALRNKRLLSRSHVTDLQSGEAASHRSGDSVGVHSYMSGGQLSGRAGSTPSPSIIELWARGCVLTPHRDSSRGTTPVHSPADGAPPPASSDQPAEQSPSIGERSPSVSVPRGGCDLAQQLAAQMHLHRYDSLTSLAFFSMLRRHHLGLDPASDASATMPACWSCIEDVEGDAAPGYIPYDQLVQCRPVPAGRQEQLVSTGGQPRTFSSAWDAFDSLFS